MTLHRPSNVDHPSTREKLFSAVTELAEILPILFPVHPRLRARLGSAAGIRWLDRQAGGSIPSSRMDGESPLEMHEWSRGMAE